MGFFKTEPKKPDYNEIEFSKIDKYMNFFMRERMGDLNKTIIELVSATNIHKTDTLHELRQLHKKHLMNPNIPQREIQIMEGNRDTYVKRVAHFVDAIDFPKGYLELYDYCIAFSTQLEQLGRELQKNMFILNHFFKSELKTINKMLVDIEEKVIDIRVFFEKNNIEVLKDIQEEIKKRTENDNKILDLKEHIANEEAQISVYADKIKKLNERIVTITGGADYRTLQGFLDEKAKIEDEIKHIVRELRNAFSELDTALRKYYYRNQDKKILKLYLDDVGIGLLEDPQLEIVSILPAVKECILNNTVELKDKKREHTLEIIDRLNATYLREQQSMLNKWHEQKQHVQTKITHNSASLNLSEQQYGIKNTQDRISDHEREIEKYALEIKKIAGKNAEIMEQIRIDLEKIVGEHVLIIEDKNSTVSVAKEE